MRKRPELAPVVAPRPCGHPAVTIDGETAPACMWGRPGYPPLPVEAPEFAAIEESRREHATLGILGGEIRWIVNAALLDPFGQPWPEDDDDA